MPSAAASLITVDAATLEIAKFTIPGLMALLGVGLGSRFIRGREDRGWRRDQLVRACSDFIKAASAVEQWAESDQFASRLGSGQYPTDYKQDLEKLAAAEAVLAVSTPESLSAMARDASVHLRGYVAAKAAHQARKPKGDPTDPHHYRQQESEWKMEADDIKAALVSWTEGHERFLRAARSELAKLH